MAVVGDVCSASGDGVASPEVAAHLTLLPGHRYTSSGTKLHDARPHLRI